MKIGIINYEMGNIESVKNSIVRLGYEYEIIDNSHNFENFNRLILPGVGSFKQGMDNLVQSGIDLKLKTYVKNENVKLLGICLGMQMLATFGDEGGGSAGLDLIPGNVSRMSGNGSVLKLPHVGWNQVYFMKNNKIFNGMSDCLDFYFVHSYFFIPDDKNNILATTFYGSQFPCIINKGNVFGYQFHPEKSSKAGSIILKNFIEN